MHEGLKVLHDVSGRLLGSKLDGAAIRAVKSLIYILGWWHVNRPKYPTVGEDVSCHLDTIPMSSSTSASFSIDATMIRPTFDGLDPEIVEALNRICWRSPKAAKIPPYMIPISFRSLLSFPLYTPKFPFVDFVSVDIITSKTQSILQPPSPHLFDGLSFEFGKD